MRKMGSCDLFRLSPCKMSPFDLLGNKQRRETFRVCYRMHARLLGTCFEFKTQKERQVGTALETDYDMT